MNGVATAPSRPRWWLDLARYGRPHWMALTLLLLLLCLDAGISAVRPWPLKLIVDHVLIGDSVSGEAAWLTRLPGATSGGREFRDGLLVWLASFTVLIFLAGQAMDVALGQLRIVVGQRMVRALRMRVFDRLQRLSLRFHRHHLAGDLITRVMNDCSCVRDLLMNVLLSKIAVVIRASAMFAVMWQLDRTLASIVLLTALPLGVISRLFSRGMTGARS